MYKKRTKKNFEKRFEEKIVELLVLTKENINGGAVDGEYLQVSIDFFASIDLETEVLSCETGRMQWLVNNVPTRQGWEHDFKQFEIYHIKAKKMIPIELQPYMSKKLNNCYMVLEIIKEEVSGTRLDKIKERISKPIEIRVADIGYFTLDRQFSCFNGDAKWLGVECNFSLETDEEDGESANLAITILKQLYADSKQWDNKFRKYAAERLTNSANDWQQENSGEDTLISMSSFANRLKISEIVIYPNGSIVIYYSDDDMFWGHTVIIDANINGKMLNADIAG